MSQESKKHILRLRQRNLGAIFGIILSRISGVLRTLFVNATFGFGIALDAFNAAFRLPNGLRDLFADGAFSAAFIKVYTDAKMKNREEEKKLISIASGVFLLITVTLSCLFATFSDFIMQLVVSDKFETNEGFYLASHLFKILAFFLPFTMLNSLAMAVLGVHGKTFRAMNASIFFNVGMIFGALVLAPAFMSIGIEGVFGLAVGAILGVFAQMIYQFKPLYKTRLLTWPSFNFALWKDYKPIREIILLMTPRAFAQGALTLALLINTYFATTLGTGVLTYIVTTVTIIQVPIGLFGVSAGFSVQPLLSETLHHKDTKNFSILLCKSLEKTLVLASIAVVGLVILIVPTYHFIFQYGKITYYDTIQNSIAVCAYSIGIVFAAGSKVIISAFFAFNRTRYLVLSATIYLCVSATLSYLLTPRIGILGLGLSYGTATALDFLLNLFFFKQTFSSKYGQNPYAQAKKLKLKVFLFSVFSYLMPLIGLLLINNFWKSFKF